jgi:hypothetical protein
VDLRERRQLDDDGEDGPSSSAGYGLSLQRQNVITPQLFRQVRQNDALALLSIGGNDYDDVLTMPPVFIGTKRISHDDVGLANR